jgi:rsbT antagonist protein RsbS
MGTDTVLVGMRPEVAATLVRMGFSMQGVHTALNVDEGLALLAQLQSSERRP